VDHFQKILTARPAGRADQSDNAGAPWKLILPRRAHFAPGGRAIRENGKKVGGSDQFFSFALNEYAGNITDFVTI
jgi:hypothetical protein